MVRFECHYCDAVLPDFKKAVEHFEAKHRSGDEYIVLELPAGKDGMPIIEEETEDDLPTKI